MAKKSMKEIHEGLEGVLNTLTEDVVKALDIKEEKKILEQQIRQLKDEEIQLREVVEHLKKTRDKMQGELKKKEKEEDEGNAEDTTSTDGDDHPSDDAADTTQPDEPTSTLDEFRELKKEGPDGP